MREKEVQAREKTVAQMTRDGLVQKNLVTGEKELISKQPADVSFDAYHIGENGTRPMPPPAFSKEKRKNTGVLQQEDLIFPTPTICEHQAERIHAPPGVSESSARSEKKNCSFERTTVLHETSENRTIDQSAPLTRPVQEKSERKKKKAAAIQNRGIPNTPDPSSSMRPAFLPHQNNEPMKKTLHDKESPLQFRAIEDVPGNVSPETLVDEKQTAPSPLRTKKKRKSHLEQERKSALEFAEDTPIPDTGQPHAANDAEQASPEEKTADTSHPHEKTAVPPKQQNRYEKAERQVQTTTRELEKAQKKLPQKRRLRFEKQLDTSSEKTERRLRFEKEVLPQGDQGPVLKRAGKAVIRDSGKALIWKAHQQVWRVEKENTAVEAAHKVEFGTERLVGRSARLLYRRHKNLPYERVTKLEHKLAKANRNLTYPYVWGGSNPSTSFDCSGFVSWVINHSGVGNVGRQTAQGLYNLCTPVSRANAKPGDLIFFTGTYSSLNPVTHIGIFVGGNQMLHCGDPIAYANINTSYWQSHFYSFGRYKGA